jgi:hypothetical protein
MPSRKPWTFHKPIYTPDPQDFLLTKVGFVRYDWFERVAICVESGALCVTRAASPARTCSARSRGSTRILASGGDALLSQRRFSSRGQLGFSSPMPQSHSAPRRVGSCTAQKGSCCHVSEHAGQVHGASASNALPFKNARANS